MRPPVAADLDSWAEMLADKEVARFLGGPIPRGSAWRVLAAIIGGWVMQGFGYFSVVEKATGECVGRVGAWAPEGWPGTEIGWALKRQAWGKGYAREGAETAMAWAFEALDWTEIIHCIEAENTRSLSVAKRLGSEWLRRQRLPAPFEHIEADIYGQTRAKWRSAHSR